MFSDTLTTPTWLYTPQGVAKDLSLNRPAEGEADYLTFSTGVGDWISVLQVSQTFENIPASY